MASWTDRIPRWLRNALRPARPFYRAAQLWSEADGGRMSAAMSFYGMLSLAPLLLLLVGVLGWWIDRELLETGPDHADRHHRRRAGRRADRQALASAKEPREGMAASADRFRRAAVRRHRRVRRIAGRLRAALGRRQRRRRRSRNGGTALAAPARHRLRAGLRLPAAGVAGDLHVAQPGLGLGRASGLRWNRRCGCSTKWWPSLIGAALFFGLMRMSSGPKPRSRSLAFGAVVGADPVHRRAAAAGGSICPARPWCRPMARPARWWCC